MTREQQRASMAFQDVSKINKESKEEQKRYATVVYQLIILVRTAGLLQALEFLASITNKSKKAAAEKLMNQLAEQLQRVHLLDKELKKVQKDKKHIKLRDIIRNANLYEYMLVTRELMATMVWYRRFVQSILKISPADANLSDE